jgi:hypothetical protein
MHAIRSWPRARFDAAEVRVPSRFSPGSRNEADTHRTSIAVRKAIRDDHPVRQLAIRVAQLAATGLRTGFHTTPQGRTWTKPGAPPPNVAAPRGRLGCPSPCPPSSPGWVSGHRRRLSTCSCSRDLDAGPREPCTRGAQPPGRGGCDRRGAAVLAAAVPAPGSCRPRPELRDDEISPLVRPARSRVPMAPGAHRGLAVTARASWPRGGTDATVASTSTSMPQWPGRAPDPVPNGPRRKRAPHPTPGTWHTWHRSRPFLDSNRERGSSGP